MKLSSTRAVILAIFLLAGIPIFFIQNRLTMLTVLAVWCIAVMAALAGFIIGDYRTREREREAAVEARLREEVEKLRRKKEE